MHIIYLINGNRGRLNKDMSLYRVHTKKYIITIVLITFNFQAPKNNTDPEKGHSNT